MEIVLKGKPKEIAALVLAVQGQQGEGATEAALDQAAREAVLAAARGLEH